MATKDNGSMTQNKTQPTDASVREFVDSIADPVRRRDCQEVLSLMGSIADEAPRMWGSSIVGFGTYEYRYASGRAGTWFRAGFSPRKNALTLYLMLDLDAQQARLKRLGKHTRGKSCLYIRRLADIDRSVLGELIQESCRENGNPSCGGGQASD